MCRFAPVFAVAAVLFSVAPAWAVCDPADTKQDSCLGGPDKTCAQLGSTTMDKDQKNIIACLKKNVDAPKKDDADAQIWKSMSGESVSGGDSSMIPGWPDALKCTYVSGDSRAAQRIYIFELIFSSQREGIVAYGPTGSGMNYNNFASGWSISYHLDGSYYRNYQAPIVTDCDGQSISQLAASGKAYYQSKPWP